MGISFILSSSGVLYTTAVFFHHLHSTNTIIATTTIATMSPAIMPIDPPEVGYSVAVVVG